MLAWTTPVRVKFDEDDKVAVELWIGRYLIVSGIKIRYHEDVERGTMSVTSYRHEVVGVFLKIFGRLIVSLLYPSADDYALRGGSHQVPGRSRFLPMGSVGGTHRRAEVPEVASMVTRLGGGAVSSMTEDGVPPLSHPQYHHLCLGCAPAASATCILDSGSPLRMVESAPTRSPYPPLAVLYRPSSSEKGA